MTDFSFDLSGPLADIPGNVFTLVSIIVNAVFALLFTIYRRKPADTETASAASYDRSVDYDRCSDTAKGILRQMVRWNQPNITVDGNAIDLALFFPGSGTLACDFRIHVPSKTVAVFPRAGHDHDLSIDHLTKHDKKTIITRARQLLADHERDSQANFTYVVNG